MADLFLTQSTWKNLHAVARSFLTVYMIDDGLEMMVIMVLGSCGVLCLVEDVLAQN
jgi:hypothetical protein